MLCNITLLAVKTFYRDLEARNSFKLSGPETISCGTVYDVYRVSSRSDLTNAIRLRFYSVFERVVFFKQLLRFGAKIFSFSFRLKGHRYKKQMLCKVYSIFFFNQFCKYDFQKNFVKRLVGLVRSFVNVCFNQNIVQTNRCYVQQRS